jgi:hypothetical protein
MSRGLLIAALVAILLGATNAAPPVTTPDSGLRTFRAWLDREHPGYGSDEGPARFRNATVEAAYPYVRLYYVLTYTRGIQPPFPNSLSLVAAVDSDFVIPFEPRKPESYRRGLKKVSSKKDAQLAAAAVLILGSCGERRYNVAPDRISVKKSSKGWLCTYSYGYNYSSWVRFDKKGIFQETGGSAPPVP